MMFERALIDYIPPVLAETAEFSALLAAEEQPVAALWAAQRRVLDEQFADTCSEAGLARWEAMLRLAPSGSEQARKDAVMRRLREEPPYTLSTMTGALDAMIGAGAYEMSLEGYVLVLRIPLKADLGAVHGLLRRVLPANIALDLGPCYMTHGRLAGVAHETLGGYTHRGVREAARL